eukprot:144009-Rhodomonas_salina.5
MDENVIGCALLQDAGLEQCFSICYLNALCVLPAFRRQGVGAGILQHVREMGVITALYVDVGPDMESLVDWYTRNGYRQHTSPSMLSLQETTEALLVSTLVSKKQWGLL